MERDLWRWSSWKDTDTDYEADPVGLTGGMRPNQITGHLKFVYKYNDTKYADGGDSN